VSLWPDEYERFRNEARTMAATITELFAAGGATVGTDPGERLAARRAQLAATELPSPLARETSIGGVACRTFAARAPCRGIYLHIHGGGFVLGSPRMNDTGNAEVAERRGVDVVSVDYRLAPEHPYPAAVDDCFAVAAQLIANHDSPLVIGGESAGANLAVLTLLRVRDELGAAGRFRGANLVFGGYDLSGTPSRFGVRPTDVPDILEPDTGSGHDWYLPGRSLAATRDPAVSPLYADLRNMPPALFTVGSADHLLDDSLFMAARWQAYGNKAELAVYPDCIHGFVGFPTELARRANERIATFLDRVFTAGASA
jgi:acetyl esterase/lipase